MVNKSVIKMKYSEAEDFFLKAENYCNLELPEYFDFSPLLNDIYNKLKGKKLSDFNNTMDIRKLDNVNYRLMNNKDGQYAWRPYEIIHPAIYVQLVKDITQKDNWILICDRLKKLQHNKKIVCCSMPFESGDKDSKKSIILNWWNSFEQQSIAMALEYEYIACTDITNCYGEIYTHTISWAIHTKKIAKENIGNDSFIGNVIDKTIQKMHYNQTNGIPQGSVLMDFIAEIVLSYADDELFNKLESQGIKDYKILRYRDDYKIYAHDNSTLNKILKSLTEVLSEINFKLNSQKTILSDDIISNSIKNDKIYSIENLSNDTINLQKYLLVVRDFVKKYNSSGTVITILKNLYSNKIIKSKNNIKNALQMISLLVDIMLINPKTYGVCSAIISKLLKSLNRKERERIIELIKLKFNKVANTDYLEIWIQRLTIADDRNVEYDARICQKIYKNNKIWNSDWTTLTIKEKLIIDNSKVNNIKSIIGIDEIKKVYDGYDY